MNRLFSSAAAMLCLSAHSLQSQEIVTGVDLRRACFSIWAGAYKTDSTGLRKICNNNVDPRSRVDSARADIDKIKEIGRAITDSAWSALAPFQSDSEAAHLSNAGPPNLQFNESAIIWGVAQFVANRAKAQAEAAALTAFVNRLCSDDGKRLLPNSCRMLTKDPGIIDALRTPALIRTAAIRDASTAPPILLDLYIEKHEAEIGPRLDEIMTARMLLQAVMASVKSKSADEALAAVVSAFPRLKAPLSVERTPVATGLFLAGLTQASVGQSLTHIKDVYPSTKYAAMYTAKAIVINLVLGRPTRAPFLSNSPIWSCNVADAAAKETKCPYQAVEPIVTAAIQGLNDLSTLRAGVDGAKDELARRKALVGYADGLLKYVIDAAVAGSSPALQWRAKGVTTLVSGVASAFAEHDYLKGATALIAIPDELGIEVELPASALRAVNLGASLAAVDSASQVASLLESVVASSRTYLDKRNSDKGGFITLNAYAGGSTGWESIGATATSAPGSAQYGAAYVPIGLEGGFPLPVNVLWLFKSVSIFAQAIDIGALTSWRLSSTANVDQEPEVHFTQVFAPGVSVMLGIRQTPLVLGIGAGASPALRRVTVNNVVEMRGVKRWPMISLSMDIPILP